MNLPTVRFRLALLFLLGMVSFLCSCESQQTVTTKRVQHPIIEKYASNFDTSEGVAQGEASSFDGMEFGGAKGFDTGDYATDEIDPRAFDGATDYEGLKDFDGTKNFATNESDLSSRESAFDDQSSSFTDQKALEGGKVNDAGAKNSLFGKMFKTRDVAETSKDFGSPVEDAFEAGGSTATDGSASSMSVDDVKNLLNRR